VVGDHLVREMQERGENGVLYVFNDTLDPLNARQLRVGVNKDPELTRQFEPFCGRPICDIPDPYDCHESYSDHFKHALVDRLDRLGIHPTVVDVHRAYQLGQYAPYVATTFERYHEIQDHIAAECDSYTLRNLYRVQCPQCSCIDATEITAAAATAVAFQCKRCGLETRQQPASLRGKLSWKLDCAARWNLYRIDTEVFSAHLAEGRSCGLVDLPAFYGNHIPSVKYAT
jgi:lysyl-tRNA synthetase class 1